jgi:hypothetical protein
LGLCQRGIDAISEAQVEDGAGCADVTGVRDPIKGAASIEESFAEEGFPGQFIDRGAGIAKVGE